jgi:hypothetical protein
MKARIRTVGAIVVLLAALVAGAGSTGAQSGAPTVVSYQGQVTVDGTPYTGTGYFKFAVVDQLGMTTYWSNDGTSSGGGEPTNAVSLVVSYGLFNVLLGDTSLANMTALPATAFDGTGRALRVWFGTDGVKFDQLTPDRRVAAAPYALQAEEALQAASATEADTVDGHHAGEFAASSHNHDAAYVNEGQSGSVTSDMIVNGTITRGDIGQNGCTAGQVFQWNGTAWVCATITGATDHGALTGLADDDHPQYFNLGQAEAVTGVPAFDGGTSGASAPFTVDSSYLVAGLNADLLDGEHASAFALSGHTHEGAFWLQGGNSFGTVGTLGTNDDQALELEVNNVRALRLEPNATSPNLIGGYSGNWLTAGVYGATIGGGGSSLYLNRVTDNHGTVGGGAGNQAGDNLGTPSDKQYATVAGGRSNTASGVNSSIGGGYGNGASGAQSSVAGGASNTASAWCTSVGGGIYNTASATGSNVGGGESNTASGSDSSVGGGAGNVAGGVAATVPGGYQNQALGSHSFAAGSAARANNAGCFVWGDNHEFPVVPCDVDNGWVARASGGVWFYTNAAMSSGVYVASGGGSWASISDRNLKANVRAVNADEVLERVAALPISTWNYTSQGASIRHMGPMAQDFYAAFGVGDDDTHITTVDADGVALAAIQGLYAENQGLKAANESQQARLDDLAARLARLERGGQPPASAALPMPWFVFGILAAGGLGFGVLASAGLLIVLARRSLGTRQ